MQQNHARSLEPRPLAAVAALVLVAPAALAFGAAIGRQLQPVGPPTCPHAKRDRRGVSRTSSGSRRGPRHRCACGRAGPCRVRCVAHRSHRSRVGPRRPSPGRGARADRVPRHPAPLRARVLRRGGRALLPGGARRRRLTRVGPRPRGARRSDLGLAWDQALCAIDMATLVDPAQPVVAAVESVRVILARMRARPFLERLDAAASRSTPAAAPRPAARESTSAT